MTYSESLCNKIGTKFFCKDFVFNNLKKHITIGNKRVELCDALFECCGNYIAIQIKERSKNKNSLERSEDEWFQKVVLNDAVRQISQTLKYIENDKVFLRDHYNQTEALNKKFGVLPVILFDNSDIEAYERFVHLNDRTINIFSMQDFNNLISTFIHPMEVTNYLYNRELYFTKLLIMPGLLVDENDSGTYYVKINSELDIIIHHHNKEYSFNNDMVNASNRFMTIVDLYRKKMIDLDENYKTILRILLQIKPKECIIFMERYLNSIEEAKKGLFSLRKSLILKTQISDILIIFVASGKETPLNENHICIIADAMQLHYKIDNILIICFSMFNESLYDVNWIMYSKSNCYDADYYYFYKQAGFYSGKLTYDTLNKIAATLN